ncbi:MAG: shikimate kinase [Chloroflexota bacterium]
MNDQNIVLTGFMATGKSTIGAMLAKKLGRVFFDVDMAIEHRTGLTIPRIFANHSEPFFRAIEKGIIHEVCLQKNWVIATGGGAIMDDESRETLLRSSFVVCLNASPAEIEARLRASDARPLAGEWRERLAERTPIYNLIPNQVDTTDKSPEAITEEIIALWQQQSQ